MKFRTLLFALALVLAGVTLPLEASPAYYLPSSAFLWQRVIVAPPPADSPEGKSDLAEVLQLQKSRTPADITRIKSEENLQPEIFSQVLGPRFTRQNAQHTFALLDKISEDVGSIAEEAKSIWNRPRPSQADKRVIPCIALPGNPSYPSGHTTLAYAWAAVLAEIFPDRAKALMSRAELVGQDRIKAGVHHPSDVAAGHQLGLTVAQLMHANPNFRNDLSLAEDEAHLIQPPSAGPRTPAVAPKKAAPSASL
jgi:acid phosphatase (class A)